MEYIHFTGLQKWLDKGSSITVSHLGGSGMVASTIETYNPETSHVDPIIYEKGRNVISSLNKLSSHLVKEKDEPLDSYASVPIFIDKVINSDYMLFFSKLPNGMVLSTIYSKIDDDYIPIKSAISGDIQTSFEMLEASLQAFDFDNNEFFNFAEEQIKPIREYKKTRRLDE